MRRSTMAIIAALLVAAVPAAGQDLGGVFDMGQLTGTLSTDHVTQSERARAEHRRGLAPATTPRRALTPRQARAARNPQVIAHCAKLPRFRSVLGSANPTVTRLGAMCASVGR